MQANKQLTIFDPIMEPGAVIELPQEKERLFELRDLTVLEQRKAEGIYKELRRPFSEALDRLRDEHKPKIDHLGKLKGLVNKELFKIEKVERDDQAAKDLERMKLIEKSQEGRQALARTNRKPQEPGDSITESDLIVHPQAKPQKVRVRKVQRWTVLEWDDIPDNFKPRELNASMLKQAAKAGIKVPGIKFWKEEVPY